MIGVRFALVVYGPNWNIAAHSSVSNPNGIIEQARFWVLGILVSQYRQKVSCFPRFLVFGI